MQTRHRIPTIFNLSMVDVLCCALGCVILLWLLNFREARQRTVAAGETGKHLTAARAALSQSESKVLTLTRELDAQRQMLNVLRSERDQAQQTAEAARKEHNTVRLALEKELAGLRTDQENLQDRKTALEAALVKQAKDQQTTAGMLAQKTKERADIALALTTAEERIRTLQTQLKDSKDLAVKTTRRADELAAGLQQAEGRVKKLDELIAGLQVENKGFKDRLAAAQMQGKKLGKEHEEQLKELLLVQKNYQDLLKVKDTLASELAAARKDLAGAQLSIGGLKLEKMNLASQVKQARVDAENRFAGISLTGKKVIFLVDMSGSMGYIDEHTLAPNKWPLLIAALVRIMTSLPDRTHYQVILFSDRITYLHGHKRTWLEYRPKTSAKNTSETLAKIKPRGETDMYAAFAEAFHFRQSGLDTIYVLSDGLPNIGEGLPPNAAKLSETERAVYLSKHVRKMLKTDWNRPLPKQPRVRINSIGFFYESPDVGAFLWAMSRENDGSFVGMSAP
jgi:hypothetical protein